MNNTTLILWLGAFWFAMARYLARLHPERTYYWYERDTTIVESIQRTRLHPYFFSGVALPDNVVLVENLDIFLPSVDTIIIAIPTQVIWSALTHLRSTLRPGITCVNLAKWIDNISLKTVSDMIWDALWDMPYTYSILSGGMIADELISGAPLWATIGCADRQKWDELLELFQSDTLDISLTPSYRDVELISAIKNIFAMVAGYYEWLWYRNSTIWYYLTRLYRELPYLIRQLGWSGDLMFWEYAIGGDIIATCYGASRNRYFGQLVGSGKNPNEAVEILRNEKKFAEWYETLKWLQTIICSHDLPHFQEVAEIFFPEK